MSNIVKEFLLEDSRSSLLQRSKRGKKERDGKTRYEKRLNVKMANSVRSYNNIDMDKLFKEDILDLFIPIVGETAGYMVRISFGDLLDRLKKRVQKKDNEMIELKDILRSVIEAFNGDNVYIWCECLHPSTQIKLLDGTVCTVEEMEKRFSSGEKLYVYSTDENGDFKPGEVEKVWVTGVKNDFVKVTLDNGEEIITTPEHPYMLRDGKYLFAKDLVEGQSLMPMYFRDKEGYEQVKLNTTNRYVAVYKRVAKEYYSDLIEETSKRATDSDNMTYKVAIHHKDFNKCNNSPENLQIMTAREHWDYHSSLLKEKWNNEEYREKHRKISSENAKKRNANPTPAMIENRKKFQEAGRQSNYREDRRKQQSELMRRVMAEYYANLTDEERELLQEKIQQTNSLPEIKEKRSNSAKNVWESYTEEEYNQRCQSMKEANDNPEYRQHLSEGIRRHFDNMTDEQREAHAELCRQNIKRATDSIRGKKFTDEHRKRISQSRLKRTKEQNHQSGIKCNLTKIKNILLAILNDGNQISNETYNEYRKNGCPKWNKYFNSLDEAISYFELNHKVKRVEFITLDDTPVYDIKVKDYENFLVNAGVVLHNCPDWTYRMSYWATQTNITSGPPQVIPSDITNPNNDLGPGCKHVMLVLSNTKWIVKTSAVIFNYINYIKVHREKLYADIIYPAIFDKPYEKDVQLDVFDDTMDTARPDIDKAQEYAKTKTQFKKGNQSGLQFAREDDDKDQLPLEN